MNALHPNNIYECYNIPIYQRLFTWGKEQIETLLDDLLYEFLSTKGNGDYYLGVLTLTDNASGRKDLVDGQQRFTVLTLIGLVFLCRNDVETDWFRFLMPDSKLRLDFSARPDDSSFIERLLAEAKNQKLSDLLKMLSKDTYVNDTMKKALQIIDDYISNTNNRAKQLFTGRADLNEHISVQAFSQYIFEHLTFYSVELPHDYTARMLNTHFERMNSTGRNLENHEILKVSLLKEIHKNGGDGQYNYFVQIWNTASRMTDLIQPFYDEKTRAAYIKIIKQIQQSNNLSDAFGIVEENQEKQIYENCQNTDDNSIMAVIEGKKELTAINKNEEGTTSNYRPFLTFTDFLLQVLYILLDDKIKKGIVIQQFFNPNKLIETFKQYLGKDITPEVFITAVGKYRIIFDYYILRIDGNGSYRLASAGDKEHDKLEQYEAMLYADSSRYTYYRWIPFILEYVSNEANSIDNGQLLSALKVHDSLIDEHSETNFKNFSFRKFNNYYFRRLDYLLWEYVIDDLKDNNLEILPEGILIDDTLIKAIKEYKFHQYNSVEHFHPRSEREQKEHWGDDVKDSFGNLALISDLFNLTQSDNALALKFARVKDQISKEAKLESIKLALMYYSANQNEENWTIETMKKHEELMVTILEKSYRRTDESVN